MQPRARRSSARALSLAACRIARTRRARAGERRPGASTSRFPRRRFRRAATSPWWAAASPGCRPGIISRDAVRASSSSRRRRWAPVRADGPGASCSRARPPARWTASSTAWMRSQRSSPRPGSTAISRSPAAGSWSTAMRQARSVRSGATVTPGCASRTPCPEAPSIRGRWSRVWREPHWVQARRCTSTRGSTPSSRGVPARLRVGGASLLADTVFVALNAYAPALVTLPVRLTPALHPGGVHRGARARRHRRPRPRRRLALLHPRHAVSLGPRAARRTRRARRRPGDERRRRRRRAGAGRHRRRRDPRPPRGAHRQVSPGAGRRLAPPALGRSDRLHAGPDAGAEPHARRIERDRQRGVRGHGIALGVRVGQLVAGALTGGSALPGWGALPGAPAT